MLDALRMTAERAIAALLLSPPSVIALRPIRIEKTHNDLARNAWICKLYTECEWPVGLVDVIE